METVFGISALMSAVFSAVLLVLAIVLPISAYAAQKYARLCYKELQTLNRTMDQFSQRILDEEG
jgi:hypothetical protein